MKQPPKLFMWCGQLIEELSKEQLVEALRHNMEDLIQAREERSKVAPYIDWRRYFSERSFQPGDHVRIADPRSTYHGQKGVVREVWGMVPAIGPTKIKVSVDLPNEKIKAKIVTVSFDPDKLDRV